VREKEIGTVQRRYSQQMCEEFSTLSMYLDTSPMFSLLMRGMLGRPSTPMDRQHPLMMDPGTSCVGTVREDG
jgi:hypothetical protein